MSYKPENPNDIESVQIALDAANEALQAREDALRELRSQLDKVREAVAG